MPLPPYDRQGYLPEGLHLAALAEIRERCGRGSPQRRRLFGEFEWLVGRARAIGARRLVLDGSFVTDKEKRYGKPPTDLDCALLLPVDYLSLEQRRDSDFEALMDAFSGVAGRPIDLFLEDSEAGLDAWVAFFALTPGGRRKGNVEVIV